MAGRANVAGVSGVERSWASSRRPKTRAPAWVACLIAVALAVAAGLVWEDHGPVTYLATGTLTSSQEPATASSSVDRAEVWSASTAIDASGQIEALNRNRLFDEHSITITEEASPKAITNFAVDAQQQIDELNDVVAEVWASAVAAESSYLERLQQESDDIVATTIETYGEALVEAISQSPSSGTPAYVRTLAATFDKTAYEFATEAVQAISAQKTQGLVERERAALEAAQPPQFVYSSVASTWAPRPTLGPWLRIAAIAFGLLAAVLFVLAIARRLVRRSILGALLALALAVVGLVAWSGLTIRDEVDTITATADRIQNQLGGSVDLDAFATDLDQLSKSAATLRSAATRPWVEPARFLPSVGQQYESTLELLDEVDPAIEAARDLLAAADDSSAGLRSGSMSQAEAIAGLRSPATSLREQVGALTEYSPGPLPEDVERRWSELQEKAAESIGSLDRLEAALAIITSVQSGDRWLLVGGNTAEQKAGFGGFLQFGLMDATADGEIRIGEFRGTGSQGVEGHWPDPNPDDVPLTSEEEFHMGNFNPNDRWAKLGFDPYFNQVARMASVMWESIGQDPVAGVLYVDPIALALLLDETGPIDFDGEPITGDRLLEFMFEGQYAEFGSDRTLRQEEAELLMRASAVSLFDLKSSSTAELATIARVFDAAASERHVAAWHRSPEVQSLIERGGLSGMHGSDSFFAWMHTSVGKFDAYLDATNVLDIECGSGSATLTVTTQYQVELGGPLDKIGFNSQADWDFAEPTYVAVAGVKFPQPARQVDVPDFDGVVSRGRMRDSDVHTGMIKIDDGTTYEHVMRFEVPAPSTITIDASGRLGPSSWEAGDDQWDGRAAHDVAICQ